MKKEDLIKLSSSDYHESIGVFTKWKPGGRVGQVNLIDAYYTADQCETILDDICGIDGWGCEYREVAGILFCTIQIQTENGIIEKADAGGAREAKKNLVGVDKKSYEDKTAATSAFVRASAKLGVGRHLSDLPQVMMKIQGGVAIAPNGARLATPEALSAYCNKMSPAILHLVSAYNMCKNTFESNDRAKTMFAELREIIENSRS